MSTSSRGRREFVTAVWSGEIKFPECAQQIVSALDADKNIHLQKVKRVGSFSDYPQGNRKSAQNGTESDKLRDLANYEFSLRRNPLSSLGEFIIHDFISTIGDFLIPTPLRHPLFLACGGHPRAVRKPPACAESPKGRWPVRRGRPASVLVSIPRNQTNQTAPVWESNLIRHRSFSKWQKSKPSARLNCRGG